MNSKAALVLSLLTILAARSSLPATECDVLPAAAAEERSQALIVGHMTEQIGDLLKEESRLRARLDVQAPPADSDPAVTLGAAEELFKIEQQIFLIRSARFFELRRLRDIRMVAHIADLQLEEPPSDELSAEYALFYEHLKRVRIGNALVPDGPILSRKPGERCDLEEALLRAARTAREQWRAVPGLEGALATRERIRAKYSGAAESLEQFDAADQATLTDLAPILTGAEPLTHSTVVLVRLARVESVSKIILLALRQDLNESPGNPEYLGTTWRRWLADGKITKEQNLNSGFFNGLDERTQVDTLTPDEDRRFGYRSRGTPQP